MKNPTIVTRTVSCQYERCGGTVFEKDYSRDDKGDFKPAWKCCNCLRETPRIARRRRTNRQRAMDLWSSIRDKWKSVDDSILALVDAKVLKSGAYLVYGSTCNYHLEKLLSNDNPTNFDLHYHADKALEELAGAKAFVAEEKGKLCPSK